MAETPTTYPVKLSIDYPDRELNRLTTFFRIFTAVPILIIIGLLTSAQAGGGGNEDGGWSYSVLAGLGLP